MTMQELDLSLASLEWSPDEKYILFSTVAGEVWLYDSSGNAVSKLSLYCNEGYAGASAFCGQLPCRLNLTAVNLQLLCIHVINREVELTSPATAQCNTPHCSDLM